MLRQVARGAINSRCSGAATNNSLRRLPCRALSTSRISGDRAPTFTTPAEPPRSEQPHDPTKPLPATGLPVEDYASPLLHTASFFGTLFRYAVYGSVAIVAVTVGSITAVHLWIEHVELAGAGQLAVDGREAVQGWTDDVEGWSGAHRGGGTDPRLGVFARSAIRGAWIAQHWGAGVLGGPVSQASAGGATPFSSSFGGAMIGRDKPETLGSKTESAEDHRWRLAEHYLQYALARAANKGISLLYSDQVADSNSTHSPRDVDRAAVELEERLAYARERLGGRYKLEQAREGWERIYYAVSSSPDVRRAGSWAECEKIRASRRIGELSARLAQLYKEGSDTRSLENAKAEGWIIGSLMPALAATTGQPLNGAIPLDTRSKSASPKSSFFAFWARSHPASTDVVDIASRPELATLVHMLSNGANSSTSLSPATARAVVSSVVALETLLARNRALNAAQSLQSASLDFVRSLTPTNDNPNAMPRLDTSQNSKAIANVLSQLFFASRTAVLSTHHAEVSLALDSKSASSAPTALTELQGALNTTSAVVSSVESSALAKPPAKGLFGSRGSPEQRVFGSVARMIVKDARRTGVMASNLTALVNELSAKTGGQRSAAEWSGGDASAEIFYKKAVEFAMGGQEGVVDEAGLRQAEAGYERTQARLQKRV